METISNEQISKEFVNPLKSSPIPIIKKSASHQSLLNLSSSGGGSGSYCSSGSSTPTASSSPSSSWTPDVFNNIITSLTSWLKGMEHHKVSEEEYKTRENELWNDWEWILSTTEEFLIKQNQTESARVLGELDILKKAASNLKVKPIFIGRANKSFSSFTKKEIEIISSSSLDPNKRLGIITTAINQLEVDWLNYIKEQYFFDDFNNDNNNNDNNNDNNNNNEQQDNESSSSPLNSLNSSSNNTQFELAEEGWEDNLNNSTTSTSSIASSTAHNDNISIEETKEVRKLDTNSNSTLFDMIVLKKNINKITWDQFMENFKGSKYSKGIHGRMKDLGWQASHGVDGSLNSRVLGDITWSIWNTLSSGIKQIREPTVEESNALIDLVCSLQPILIQMWLDTKKNSRIGSMNEGIVVEKWKQEETTKKKKILEMKKSGLLDKYNPEKIKVLDHERKEISQIRLNLEKKLKLKK